MVSIEDIKFKFYNSYIDECQSQAEEFVKDKCNFDDYCLAQYFIVRCLFEKNKVKAAKEKYNILQKEIKERKGNQIDENDLFMQATYLQHLYNLDLEAAEQSNPILLEYVQEYKKQNEDHPHYVKGLYLYGLALHSFFENFREQNDQGCITNLKQALNKAPQYKYEIINSLGMILYDKNMFQEALEITEKMYLTNKRFLGFSNNLAFLYTALGQLDRAEELYLEALNYDPQNTVILNNISHFYFNEKQDQQKGIEYIQKSLEIQPEDSGILYRLGYYLSIQNMDGNNQEQYNKGISFLEKSIECNKFNYKSYLSLCQFEINRQNLEKASKYLSDLLELKPQTGYIFFQIAEQYESMGQRQKAIEYFLESLKYKLTTTTFLECHSRLSTCYYLINEYEKSLQINLQAINSKYFSDDIIAIDINEITHFLKFDNKISDDKKVEIINSFYGPIQNKFHLIFSKIALNPHVQKGLMLKMQQYSYTMLLQVYNKQIIPHLNYQNEISHWDLYID